MFTISASHNVVGIIASKTLALGILAGAGMFSTPVEAFTIIGFQGSYNPSNFILENINADGTVDVSSAPDSITLIGGNNGSGDFGQTNYVAEAVDAGTVMFNFSYESFNVDGPLFDPFGIVLNENFIQLTDNNGPDSQNGVFSFNINEGDRFGFAIQTLDNVLGASEATITNFKVTTPEPASLLGLLSISGLCLAVRRKRQV